jgi:uncharacterized protein YcfJ
MPAATKKRPPMEMEPGEGKAHESAESAAEETREGAEPDDAPKAKTNRKRSAKNAKATKAPMDGGMYGKKPMDGEGCNCGKRKAKCDGSCGKKMDRNDALTPQEYLAACDLGIQGRSRSYIRARLDAAERLDLKCGKGSISKGEKCSKGAATAAENAPISIRKGLKVGAKIGGGLGAVQGAMLGGALGGGPGGALAGAAIGAASGALQGAVIGGGVQVARKAGAAYGRSRERNRNVQAGIAKLNPKFKKQYETAKARGASRQELTQLSIKQAGEIDKLMNKRRDSVYAAGFSPELDQLAI